MEVWDKIAVLVFGLILIIAFSFFANAGILWLICKLLNMSWWSWRTATAIWLIEALISSMFHTSIDIGK